MDTYTALTPIWFASSAFSARLRGTPFKSGGWAVGDLNGDGIPVFVTNGISILFGNGKGASRRVRIVLAKPVAE